jgi:hypothetical protein
MSRYEYHSCAADGLNILKIVYVVLYKRNIILEITPYIWLTPLIPDSVNGYYSRVASVCDTQKLYATLPLCPHHFQVAYMTISQGSLNVCDCLAYHPCIMSDYFWHRWFLVTGSWLSLSWQIFNYYYFIFKITFDDLDRAWAFLSY